MSLPHNRGSRAESAAESEGLLLVGVKKEVD